MREVRDRGRWLCPAAALAALVVLGPATPVLGQTASPDDSLAQSRSLRLSPTLQFTDIGWDDNVFRVTKDANPDGDFTATARAAVQPVFRLRRLRFSGRNEVDFVYFKRLSQIRSIDTDNAAHVELQLGRLKPYIEGDWARTRHRPNFEIDLPVRRVESSWNGGVDLRLSGKTSVGVMSRRSRVDYEGETIYLDTDLARYLGVRVRNDGVQVKYALTPFTTVGAVVERDRNEFPSAPERNSDGFRWMSVVEFQPLALVSGRAQIGIRKRTFVDGSGPPFKGAVARIDLGYTLLGRTQIAVLAERDLSYSYRADERDYLQTGVQLSVNHRLANAWDVVGTFGRFNLTYDVGQARGLGLPSEERVSSYGLDIGYRIDRTRVGFGVARQMRGSDFSVARQYEATRIGSSLSYRF